MKSRPVLSKSISSLSGSVLPVLQPLRRRSATIVGAGFALAALSAIGTAATVTWNTSGIWDTNATGTADTVQIATTAGSRVIIALSADDAITNLNGIGGGGGAGAVYQTAGNLVASELLSDS